MRSAIKKAATKIMFVEEIYDGAATNYNHDGWPYGPGRQMLWDPLGICHSDSCTFSLNSTCLNSGKEICDEREKSC